MHASAPETLCAATVRQDLLAHYRRLLDRLNRLRELSRSDAPAEVFVRAVRHAHADIKLCHARHADAAMALGRTSRDRTTVRSARAVECFLQAYVEELGNADAQLSALATPAAERAHLTAA